MSGDLYDALERRHEEREKAADALAEVLGVAKPEPEKPRDEGGRFVGNADAAGRTPTPPPARRSPGARLHDALLYGDAGDEYEIR